jgi:drug/metabolite transporter (DMT)-like permease
MSMESWLLFAFLAPLFWAFTNVLGKFLVDKHLKNPYVLNAYCNITFFALTVPVALFFGLGFSPTYVLVALAAGLFGFLANLLFAMAFKVEEASRVVPISFLYPVFASFFAFLLLGETVGPLQYAGAALLVLGSFLVLVRGSLGKIVLSPALKFSMSDNVVLGLVVVLEKLTLSGLSAASTLFWVNLGMAVASAASIMVSRKNRSDAAEALAVPRKIAGLVWLDSAFSVAAVLLFYIALSMGPATLVSAINAIQPFFVLVIIILLSRFLPHILQEKFTRSALLLKVLAVVAVLIGAYLVSA